MPIDPRQTPVIDSILNQLLGPVNRAVEPMMEPGSNAIDIINRRTNRPVAGKPGAPTMGQSFAGAVLNALGAFRPSAGLPTSRFSAPTMPLGYRNFASREAGTPGALPERDFIQPLTPESYTTPTGRPRISENTSMAGFTSDNPGLNTIFRNMPDFPQSVPRNLRDTPHTPYPGTTEGMARRRGTIKRSGVAPIDWEREVPRIVESLRVVPGYTMSDAAGSLRVNISTIRRELINRGHTPPTVTGSRASWTSVDPIKREEIVQQVLARKISANEGAKILKVTPTAVFRLVQRRRENPEGPSRPLHRNLGEILKMEAANISYDRIAAQFGGTPQGVRDLLRRQGLYGNRLNASRGRPATNPTPSIPQSSPTAPPTVDAGIASMMRDSEQRMLNQRMSQSQINSALSREFGLSEDQLQGGWWRSMR